MARNRKKHKHVDHSAGNEGIDDPAMMSTEREGSGESMRRSSSQQSTRGQDNDRQQGRESTDNNSSSFSGQGDQREGAENPEGTGYTNRSNTDDSDVLS